MTKQRWFVAGLALMMVIAGLAYAEDAALGTTLSAYTNAEAPAPDVPDCERVEDAYFANAVLVGDSMGDGFAIHNVVPGLEVLARIGFSPESALTSETFQVDGKPVTLADKLAAMQPDAVYLWMGSNTLAARGVEQIIQHYDSLLNQLLAVQPSIPFYLLEVTPMQEVTDGAYGSERNEQVDAFNRELREMAVRHNVYVLPVNALLRDEKGELGEIYAAEDGIHLLKPAYEVLAEYIVTHVLPEPAE